MHKRLKARLKECGYTVAELSRLSGVPVKTLYHWTTGQQPRKMDHLLKVCAVLKISVEELYGQPPPQVPHILHNYEKEIHAGLYEVILRPTLTKKED
ncbi:MAG TPA: helix-turn-helix transcriptional regulator [Pseudobdellovibrionaceae bacterium]|nr:helix-turn-helix transcriptional regulator [Pseudobdellovibrionaceae bacterium]